MRACRPSFDVRHRWSGGRYRDFSVLSRIFFRLWGVTHKERSVGETMISRTQDGWSRNVRVAHAPARPARTPGHAPAHRTPHRMPHRVPLCLSILIALFFAICPVGTPSARLSGSAFSPNNAEVALGSRPDRQRTATRATIRRGGVTPMGAGRGGGTVAQAAFLPRIAFAKPAPSRAPPLTAAIPDPCVTRFSLCVHHAPRAPPTAAFERRA